MNNCIAIVAKIEALLGELKTSLGVRSLNRATDQRNETPADGFSGLTASIHSLVEDGFFKVGKTIGEIQTKLRLEGVVAPTTSLSGPLLHLIRKKILSRSK